MLPVFKEYAKYLQDTTGLILEEGYYWIDNQIIKAFNKNGEVQKLYRVKVEDDLSVRYIQQKEYPKLTIEDLESWEETIIRRMDILLKNEQESLFLIQECLEKYSDYIPEILTSGGKDSNVQMHLIRNVNNNIHAFFNNTTLDCSDTYKFIKTVDNLDIINPDEGFYNWQKRMNFIPTKLARACCTIFKEGAMVDKLDSSIKYIFFLGMRNEESPNRSEYLDYWDNKKWNENWKGCLPIRKWSELDIWLYIFLNNIPINDKYKKGYSRVGCGISCPFYSKTTWSLDSYWYPQMRERWSQILIKDFRENNKDVVNNCTEQEYLLCWNSGTFRKEPTEEVIQQFAERNNLDINIAEKYFNHTCDTCGKKVTQKNVLGMNMKIHGRDVNRFFCKKCLSKELGVNRKQWTEQINNFKEQGCDLF